MLSAEKRNIADRKSVLPKKVQSKFRLPSWFFGQPAFGFALSLALVILGFLAGFAVRGGFSWNGETSTLRSEVSEMKQALTLSLLNQTTTTDRLRGVQLSRHRPKNRTSRSWKPF